MRAAVVLQYLLPHRLLSRIVHRATRWTWRPWKNLLIRRITSSYAVNLDEAVNADVEAYEHFNAFFTRALKTDARPQDADPRAVLCPADGRISQAGPIRAGRIFQAKGRDYSAAELARRRGRRGGLRRRPLRHRLSVTARLPPRAHAAGRAPRLDPACTGTPVQRGTVRGRGDPAPVRPQRASGLSFRGGTRPFVVLVGAMLVSSVSTVWNGLEIRPMPRARSPATGRTASCTSPAATRWAVSTWVRP